MVDKEKLAFDVLSDPELKLIGALGLTHPAGSPDGKDISIPATFLVDKDGTIAWRYLGKTVMDRATPEQMIQEIRKLK